MDLVQKELKETQKVYFSQVDEEKFSSGYDWQAVAIVFQQNFTSYRDVQDQFKKIAQQNAILPHFIANLNAQHFSFDLASIDQVTALDISHPVTDAQLSRMMGKQSATLEVHHYLKCHLINACDIAYSFSHGVKVSHFDFEYLMKVSMFVTFMQELTLSNDEAKNLYGEIRALRLLS